MGDVGLKTSTRIRGKGRGVFGGDEKMLLCTEALQRVTIDEIPGLNPT